MAVYYLDKQNGSDSNDGTSPGRAFQTLGKAIQTDPSTDTLVGVASGNFGRVDLSPVGSEYRRKAWVTLAAYGTCVIEGGYDQITPYSRIRNAAKVRFKDFLWRGGLDEVVTMFGIMDGSRVEVIGTRGRAQRDILLWCDELSKLVVQDCPWSGDPPTSLLSRRIEVPPRGAPFTACEDARSVTAPGWPV